MDSIGKTENDKIKIKKKLYELHQSEIYFNNEINKIVNKATDSYLKNEPIIE
jgi:hypothetical protein